MTVWTYERIDETVVGEELDNGLKVYCLPRPAYRQTFASFTARYGSIDREFVDPGRGEIVRMPDGIAHFLEHKMFEKEDGDVFRLFSQYGAQPNAATSFDMTTYHFSCTAKPMENLGILLDFVQQPYFSDASVEKEKGIITQELMMYEDSAHHRVLYGLLRAFFGDSPLSTDIGGTVDSISRITKEDLHTCYRVFYHPGNMTLFVAGPLAPGRVLDFVRDNQARKAYDRQAPVRRVPPVISPAPFLTRAETFLAVSQPRVLFGFRHLDIPQGAKARQAFEEATGIWMDGLLGRGSELFHRLVDEGLADMGFGADFELTEHCGYSLMGGNSHHPERLADRVRNELVKAAERGIPEEVFERTRRKAVGRFFGLLDSPRAVASMYVSQQMRGIDLFATLDVLDRLTLADVNEALRAHIHPEQFAVSFVWPLQEGEGQGAARMEEGGKQAR